MKRISDVGFELEGPSFYCELILPKSYCLHCPLRASVSPWFNSILKIQGIQNA